MSKKATLIEKTAGRIYEEFMDVFNLKLGKIEEERFTLYLITRMTMIYNEGFGDGLEKAREIFKGVCGREE